MLRAALASVMCYPGQCYLLPWPELRATLAVLLAALASVTC